LPLASEDERQVAGSLASRLSDPGLRQAFERALAASLARERAGRDPRDRGAD
jgi:hypothetical protein